MKYLKLSVAVFNIVIQIIPIILGYLFELIYSGFLAGRGLADFATDWYQGRASFKELWRKATKK